MDLGSPAPRAPTCIVKVKPEGDAVSAEFAASKMKVGEVSQKD